MRKLGALLKVLGVDVRPLAAGDIVVRSPIDGAEIARLKSDTKSSVAKKIARADEAFRAGAGPAAKRGRRPPARRGAPARRRWPPGLDRDRRSPEGLGERRDDSATSR
jgi:hypothetical protein